VPFGKGAVVEAAVVDASVWVSRLVRSDVHHESTVRWFGHREREGTLYVAPASMPAEVAGAITRQTRSGRLGRRSVAALLRLPTLRVVALDAFLGEQAAVLAADLRLRGADAVYVAVARRLSLPLITWDREQAERGGRTVTVSEAR
jgi:predicted nucleic acid-binding protein